MAEGGLSFRAVEGGEWTPCERGFGLYLSAVDWLSERVVPHTRNGNISVRCGDFLLVKGKGKELLARSRSDLSCVRRLSEYEFLYSGAFPSSETLTHFALLERGWSGVVHVHPEDLVRGREFFEKYSPLELPPAGTRELYESLLRAPVGKGFFAVSHGYFFDISEILSEVE